MKVLFLTDDKWHPGEVLEKAFTTPLYKDFEFDFLKDVRDILTKEMLREYDVVLSSKSNNLTSANPIPWFDEGITDVMPYDILDYIKEGHGFVAIHAGAGFDENDECRMQDIIGSAFLTHPRQCMIHANFVKEHPILNGAKEFDIKDEHYMMKMLTDDMDIFMTSTSDTEAGTQVSGYTRTFGEGREVVLIPGHTYKVFTNPDYAKIIKNSILWAAKKL